MSLLTRAIREYGGECANCGSTRRLECDHIRPRRCGGSDDVENLQVLCHACHRLKTDRQRVTRVTNDGQLIRPVGYRYKRKPRSSRSRHAYLWS